MADPRTELPSITALLTRDDVRAHIDDVGRDAVVETLRDVVDDARRRLRAGKTVVGDEIVAAALRQLDHRRAERLRRVINATGVILHTNLGRAPLSAAAIDAMVEVAGAANLELDLVTGARGRRGGSVDRRLAELCGAEAALTVNNGAAALVLVVTALADGGDVVLSRGELVEIGGSFRLPDLLAAAGVTLREVGTTNRTHLADYEAALRDGGRAILKVHPSNFRVTGYTTAPSMEDLAALATAAGVPLVYDLGAGVLRTSEVAGTELDPPADLAISAGADLVVFSGDKLLGGPQAGAIVGRRELVDTCRRHPLARALRLDKLRLAALEATLVAHARGDLATLPTWSMLLTDPDDLRRRAQALTRRVGGDVIATEAVVGGGTTPGCALPSWAVRLPGDADTLALRLRRSDPPVIGRIVDDALVVDLRTVPPDVDGTLGEVLAAVVDLGA